MAQEKFSVVDYVVFSVMLLISAAIGVWYGCGPGGKQETTKEYLLADKKMRIVPVAISLLVSYLSAITLLGVPSEIYTYGAQYYVFPHVKLLSLPKFYLPKSLRNLINC